MFEYGLAGRYDYPRLILRPQYHLDDQQNEEGRERETSGSCNFGHVVYEGAHVVDRKGELMATARRSWERRELLLAFNLYCRTPFGRIHRTTPSIVQLAERIARTPSAVAMKMVNFASLDPFHQQRGVSGLGHASKRDQEIWQEFHHDWAALAVESQGMWADSLGDEDVQPSRRGILIPKGPTEAKRTIRVRLVQGFFRESVLSNYDYTCTMCGLNLTNMLNASHIIPWSVEKTRRADPRNGLCLCTFHDRALDRGLITVDDDFRVILSRRTRIDTPPKMHRTGFLEIEGERLRLPSKFGPDPSALAFHRHNVFVA
jgi:HNH endonuclease